MDILRRLLPLALLGACCASAQVIEFESGGLKYQTLTRRGVTVMYAHLPARVRQWDILQVAVSNGSPSEWNVQPESIEFHRKSGEVLRADSANFVVKSLMEHAGRNDVVRMVTAYEMGLYGMQRFRSTNGYEQRRQSALAEVSSARVKAAAAASAIAFVQTKLKPGESTDGAVFFPTAGRPLGAGRLIMRAAGEVFEFDAEPAAP
ncbi:MAG: hypothetical protein HY822_12300 [Acidobacteria bacterium]|nr:hypothetical protein [Acidobacteriota bacterium]